MHKYDVSCSSSGGNRKTLVKVWAIRLALEFVTPILRMDVCPKDFID
jgi:hypothetical protein